MKSPNSRRNLDIAIRRIARSDEGYVRMRTAMANTIVGQVLPAGVVKGGSAIKFRFGSHETRFTTDLDVARRESLERYVDSLAMALRIGWEGFTGTIVSKEPANPKDVPGAYVMRPFDIKLEYNSSAWCAVRLEVGHNEIGDACDPDLALPDDVRELFLLLGFPEPATVPVMRLDHQIAQKLHALSTPHSRRAHDLIDLQLIMAKGAVELQQVRRACERLFSYRKQQAWPPRIEEEPGWAEAYDDQRGDLAVLPTIGEAVSWGNALVDRIAAAS